MSQLSVATCFLETIQDFSDTVFVLSGSNKPVHICQCVRAVRVLVPPKLPCCERTPLPRYVPLGWTGSALVVKHPGWGRSWGVGAYSSRTREREEARQLRALSLS